MAHKGSCHCGKIAFERCLDGVDLAALRRKPFDGRSL
jgi:hypothetical protein